MSEVSNVNTIAQAKVNIQYLTQAIASVHQLRSTVTNVFNFLCDGVKPEGSQPSDQEEASADGNSGRDGSQFLAAFQEYLQAVNKDYNEVDKLCNSMTPVLDSSGAPVWTTLGPMASLSLDCVADKSSTYRDIALTYQWNNKLHEYAQITCSLLQTTRIKRQRSQGGAIQAKRRRPVPLKMHTISSQMIEHTIHQMTRQLPDFSLDIVMSTGDSRLLKVTIGQAFRAVIVLHNLSVEKVLIKGLDEEFVQADNGSIDLFMSSRYECMRKITDYANCAVLQYRFLQHNPNTQPEAPFLFLSRWLQSYKDVFSAPCTVCRKHLSGGLPPFWRDFRNPLPCHDSCRP